MSPSCTSCSKSGSGAPNFKKTDWKEHKKICGKNAAKGSTKSFDPSKIISNTDYKTLRVKNLDKQIDKPFTRLENHTYLHDRSEKDVYRVLIHCFRMRQEDNLTQDSDIDPNSIYGAAPSSIEGFHKFVRLASSRPRLLPPWWNADKQAECERLGQIDDDWSSLERKVKKQDIIDRYGDEKMPMQLRMLAETVYARGPGGQSGATMRRMMMTMEANAGKEGEGVMSMMSL